MWTLLDIVKGYDLAVTGRETGTIHASSPASYQSEENRFEVSVLDWDGATEKQWRGSNPTHLLESALAFSHIRDVNGITKLSLHDRHGGETVWMTNASEQESSSLVELMEMKKGLEGSTTDEDSVAAMFRF